MSDPLVQIFSKHCQSHTGRARELTFCENVHPTLCVITLNNSESIWPGPFSTGVYENEEPSPEGERDKEISLSQFILSLFDEVGQLLPGDFAGSLKLGTPVARRCCRGFLEVYRVSRVTCQVSGVTCHLSHFFLPLNKMGPSGGASRWRVCYQRGLPRLVFTCLPVVYLWRPVRVLAMLSQGGEGRPGGELQAGNIPAQELPSVSFSPPC